MTESVELLHRYAHSSDEHAFAEIVQRHINLVFSVALSRVDRDAHLAEDVTQAVFTRLAQKADSVSRHPTLTGWLYLTTRYFAINALRDERRRRKYEEKAEAMKETFPARNEPDLDWDTIQPQFGVLLDGLAERDRTPLLLRFFEGNSFAEIAAKLESTEDGSRMRVNRALEHLRLQLARRGIKSSAAALGALIADHAVVAAPANLASAVAGKALAAVSATTVPGIGLLHLMTTTKIGLGLVAGVVCLMLIATATRETRLQRQATAMLAKVNSENGVLEARHRDLQRQRDTVSTNIAAQPTTTASAIAADAGAAKIAAVLPPETKDTALKQEPEKLQEAQNMFRSYVRAVVAALFDPIFISAGLSGERLKRAEYLVEQLQGADDSLPDGVSFRSDSRSDAELQQELLDLLGDDVMQAVASTPINYKVVWPLAGNLYDTENPLLPSQAAQLSQILTASTLRAHQNDWFDPKNSDWSKVISLAQGVLSAPQIAMLKDIAVSRFNAAVK